MCPPKGRYGPGVPMEKCLAAHKQLASEFAPEVSCINECWGEMWDPRSPTYKTLGAPSVTIAVAIHDAITPENVTESTRIAVDALRRMSDYAKPKGIRLVFEATNHLEMGKFVNTVANDKRMIGLTGRDNIGIQLDWFPVNLEEPDPYEASMDAQPLRRATASST